MCPMKEFRVKSINEPWITNIALKASKDEHSLLKVAKRNKSRRTKSVLLEAETEGAQG